MKCELLAESNYALLLDFIDDVNTKYDETVLKAFLNEKNAYGYIAVDDGKAIGFAYGYVLNEPDGRKTFLSARDRYYDRLSESWLRNGIGQICVCTFKKPGLPQNVFDDKHRQRVCLQML